MAEWSAEIWSPAPATGSVRTLEATREAAAYAPRFKMRGRRIYDGSTVHWIAYRGEDPTGEQSPFPGDIDGASVVRE